MKKTLLFLLSNIFTSSLIACLCFGPTTFCETLEQFESNNQEPLIVNAVVSEKRDTGMTVTIQNVLQGELTEEEVFIKSDNGAECIFYTNGFSKDDNYIFILSEYYDNYALSVCYISFLKIENGILQGPIAPNIESLPYNDLGTLGSCENKLNLFSLDHSLVLFPNPTIENIHIKNISEYEGVGIFQLEIIDVLGRDIGSLIKEDGIPAGGDWIINVSELAAGIYFLKIISKGKEEIFRVIKQ